MAEKKAVVGTLGEKTKSDCNVSLEIRDGGGLDIDLRSKVEVLYGDRLREIIRKELDYFDIEDAEIIVEDYGANSFTVEARIEAAIKKALPEVEREYLPEMSDKCTYDTKEERFRRTRLYLPGNYPKFMLNAGIHNPDGIILDLEDSVAPSRKEDARFLVRNALRCVDFFGAERMVRINQLPMGLEDLEYVIPHNTHLILIPKCQSAKNVHKVNSAIEGVKEEREVEQDIYLMPIIESAMGVINAYEIASAAENVVAIAIGLEDYTADIGVERTKEGKESFWAKSKIVNAARAANVQPIDTVFSDINDMEGLRESVEEAKSMGFVGKGCIHPRQIQVIHDVFAPTEEEIEEAKEIVEAYEEAQEKGLGVVSLGGKMIDPPVVERAFKTVKLAISNDLLDEDWRDK